MAYGVVRLTLYALLTAIETDLRDLITTNLLSYQEATDLLPQKIYERAHARMENDKSFDVSADSGIVDYLDFAEAFEILSSSKSLLNRELSKAVDILSKRASVIAPIRNRVMHSRPLEFDDLAHVSSLSRQLLSFPSYLFPRLGQVEEFIKTDPRYVFSLNLENIQSPSAQISNNLPIPDFDETGFLGRADEAAQLLRIVRASPWPVITVLGEGGVGKTALALKVAFEILDDDQAGFDAIVWTSSKTTRLTVSDIENIDGAIRTSLGVFQDIARELQDDTATIDDVLIYLNTFKILLIMDNLETILDETIRTFLSKITSSSKILITSRVGLGELEYRFPLAPMKSDDAASLLRATAQVRRVEQIVRADNTVLRVYCNKMKNNPLFIKWFVGCVQSGRRPEEALHNSTLFLEYCLSNVIEHLSDDAKLVARAMVAIPGPHAQPVLAYLTELDGGRLQLALQQLVTANVAVLSSRPTIAGYETSYDLGDLPRQYLLKSLPPSAQEMTDFGRRRSELARAHELITAQAAVSPYSPYSIAIRNKDDVVVAKYLTEALTCVRLRQFDGATALIERAKALSPTYSEIYRVEGWNEYFRGNFAAALNAYETAIELEPRAPATRYWYAGFLLRAQHDSEGAVSQLAKARELDPASAEVAVEYARALGFQFRFDEADAELAPIIEHPALSTKLMRIAYDGWVQIAVRRGNFAIGNGDYLNGLRSFEDTVDRFNKIPGEYRDRRILDSLRHCLSSAERLGEELAHSDLADTAERVILSIEALLPNMDNDDLTGQTPREGLPVHLNVGEQGDGKISHINVARKFGFIKVDGGGQLFFHETHLTPVGHIRSLKLGQPVCFIVGENQHGLTADNVRVAAQKLQMGEEPEELRGVIVRLFPERSFGFIRGDDGVEIFFHRDELRTSGKRMSRLSPGMPVKFVLGRNDRGPVAVSIERLTVTVSELAEKVGQRLTGTVVVRRPGMSYGFAELRGYPDVVIRSQDFRQPELWNSIKIGDSVSFVEAAP